MKNTQKYKSYICYMELQICQKNLFITLGKWNMANMIRTVMRYYDVRTFFIAIKSYNPQIEIV